MAFEKPEMMQLCFMFLLMKNLASVLSQFNGYNCDTNYHSRFPGEIYLLFRHSAWTKEQVMVYYLVKKQISRYFQYVLSENLM